MTNAEALSPSSWFGDHVVAEPTDIVVCGSSHNAKSGSWTSHQEQPHRLEQNEPITVITVNSMYCYIGLKDGRGIMIERHAINEILVRKNTPPNPSPIANEVSPPLQSTPEGVAQ